MKTMIFLILTICYQDGQDCQVWVPESWTANTDHEISQAMASCENVGYAHYSNQEMSFECAEQGIPPEMTASY